MSASAPTVTETLKFTTKSIPKTTNIPMNVPKLSRKERRAEKNYVALCERSTHILPKTAFKRLVASTTNDITNGRPIRYSHEAVDALQTAVARAGASLDMLVSAARSKAALPRPMGQQRCKLLLLFEEAIRTEHPAICLAIEQLGFFSARRPMPPHADLPPPAKKSSFFSGDFNY